MNSETSSANDLSQTFGMLLLRLWLGLRALQTGIEKFAGMKSSDSSVLIDGAPNTYGLTEATASKSYSTDNYHGVPAALYNKLADEPLIPGFFLTIYNFALGPALIILGLTVLLGIATRISLFAMGLLYTSLTFGLILLKQDAGVAWLGIHVIMIVLGLMLVKFNRFALVDKL